MLVDNRTLVREGLCALIEQQPDFAVVAQAATVREARAITGKPDVIVTDVDLPDARHVDVIAALREVFVHSAILVLTLAGHPALVHAVLAAGADGYLLKTARTRDLVTGIRAVAAGETYLQPSLGVDVARWREPQETLGLTTKEEEVLRLVTLGYTNSEIANRSSVSLRTVEAHRARIHQKLGLRTRAELVRYAREAGLVVDVHYRSEP